MINRTEFIKNYWRYYMVLEDRYLHICQYIEPEKENFETYSLEFVSQLQAVGAELDVFFKVVCGMEQDNRANIADYYPEVITKYSDIKQCAVSVHDIVIIPFENWDKSYAAKSLTWWSAYNDVKHGRVKNFNQANMKNVLNALAALFILEMYALRDIAGADGGSDIPPKGSLLFEMKDWKTKYLSLRHVEFETV